MMGEVIILYRCIIIDFYLEFFNDKVRDIFVNHGINHYKTPTVTKWKASHVERVIQTLKKRIQKYFTQNNTKIWRDILQQVAENYNKTPHRSHGFAPLDVTHDKIDIVYKKLYPDLSLKTICKLKTGDKVRKIINKGIFEKGYTENWSEEIYSISKTRQQAGVCWYYLEDHNKRKEPGIFYYYQLNLVARNERREENHN